MLGFLKYLALTIFLLSISNTTGIYDGIKHKSVDNYGLSWNFKNYTDCLKKTVEDIDSSELDKRITCLKLSKQAILYKIACLDDWINTFKNIKIGFKTQLNLIIILSNTIAESINTLCKFKFICTKQIMCLEPLSLDFKMTIESILFTYNINISEIEKIRTIKLIDHLNNAYKKQIIIYKELQNYIYDLINDSLLLYTDNHNISLDILDEVKERIIKNTNILNCNIFIYLADIDKIENNEKMAEELKEFIKILRDLNINIFLIASKIKIFDENIDENKIELRLYLKDVYVNTYNLLNLVI